MTSSTSDFTFGKHERLKHRKQIEHLFASGRKVKSYPLMLAFVEHGAERPEVPVQMGFSVSKRRFKRAVDRNRVKRLMREAYRRQKTAFYHTSQKHGFVADAMLIYIGRELPVYSDLERKISALLQRWDDTLLKHATHDSIQPPPPSGD